MSETVSRVRDASGRADPRAAAGLGVPAGPEPGRGRRRRRVLVGGAAAVVAAAGVAVAVTGPFAGTGHAGGGAAGGSAASLSAIARRSLQSQTSVPATLGYAGSYTVTGHGGGTITWLPGPGRVIGQGKVLYRVNNGTPVVLLYGQVPAWRALAAAQQSEVKAGDTVAITLPTGRVTPGVVASVGKVASGGASPKVTVTVTLAHPRAAGTLDQAPVTVAITTATVKNALVVPVDALLARPGGYAVEEVTGGHHHLVPVTLGLFDDVAGLVQVSGAGLAAGQHVVVPAP